MHRQHPFPYEEFKEIFSKVPRLCIDLLIETKKGFLLTLRTKNGWLNQWHFPGGMVYYKESLTDAAKRLANEELGAEVSIKKFIGYLEFPDEEKERGFGYSVSLVFLCKLKSEDIKLDDQVEKADYFKIPPENMVKEHKKLLEEYLKI